MTTSMDEVCRRLAIDRDQLAVVDELDAADQQRLAALIDAAVTRRDAELHEAVEASMRVIPRPLRRLVRKVVGG